MKPSELAAFRGTERFEVRGHLGSGTSGDVYRVFDRQLRNEVALKTLNRAGPASIFRFKQEFRALADVTHRNLVQLYELLSEGDRWFFTMELVVGRDFITDVRGGRAPLTAPDVGRLGSTLRQLAEGLAALHDAGKLHCDIKPSNVRVTTAGRVVLLDFGLVKELLAGSAAYETLDGEVGGTPAYMSPEQAAGRSVGRASDWYGVGSLLYEALTGQVPFTGGFLKILTDKQTLDPTPPDELVPELPGELVALCGRLLARDPDQRPGAASVLGRLGGERRRGSTSTGSAASHFVGRREHLRALEDAFAETLSGIASVVFVRGDSGMGKTALIRRFMQQLREEREDAVQLAGRCYERESVPYKALDALVDSLSRYLRRLEDDEAERLLPVDVLALARLFPALRRVPAVAGAERRVLEIPDSLERRRRAFAALRELLARLAESRPVVLYIDDLQWGDHDSAALLADLLRPPAPPPLLLVACYRAEDRETSPLLRSLSRRNLAAGASIRRLEVAELATEEAAELALSLLGERTAAARELASAIARESAGSPFFIDELVRHAKAEAGLDPAGDRSLSAEVERALASRMSLGRLIEARLGRLSESARALLATASVAGRPLDLEAARAAAGIGPAIQASIAVLRGASLCRLRGARGHEEIEVYHDRIRETVVDGLDADTLRRWHRRLALALEASGRADPEALAVHFHGAGDRVRAAEFAGTAAEEAAEALAFDRAARLCRIALDLEGRGSGETRNLRVLLGDALANAGRGGEAAEAYLEAADLAPTAVALELRRRAAEQQLISGRMDAGLATMGEVLASIGLHLPSTPGRTLFALARNLFLLALRSRRFRERDATQIAAEKLIAIDTCWSVAIGIGSVDVIRGMVFGKRNLLLSLRAGEPYRVARALSFEAAYSAAAGRRHQRRTARLVHAAMKLAERVSHPHALGLINMTAGIAAYLEGRWRQAGELLARAEKILRESCTGVTWELDTTMSFGLRSLIFTGRLAEIRDRLPGLLEDVRERGDLYAEVNLRSRSTWVAMLAAGDPQAAGEEVEAAIAQWTQRGFHIQHYWHLTGRVDIALYQGEAAAAWRAIEDSWPKLERSLLLRIQLTRVEAWHTRGRAALARALDLGVETSEGRRLAQLVEDQARRMDREKLPWGRPLVQLLRAGLATARGKRDTAVDLLISAAAAFEAADMELYAAVARRRRAGLLADEPTTLEASRRLFAEADHWLGEQGVADPERLSDVFAPGLWRSATAAGDASASIDSSAGTPHQAVENP